MNNEKGTTLVKSFIIYIVVLILLGVLISFTIANNGIVRIFEDSEVVEVGNVVQEETIVTE